MIKGQTGSLIHCWSLADRHKAGYYVRDGVLYRNYKYLGQDYATAHTEKAQQRYVSRYNLRAREKSFEIGQKVLVLIPDSSSSKTFSRWVGPAVIKGTLRRRIAYIFFGPPGKYIL